MLDTYEETQSRGAYQAPTQPAMPITAPHQAVPGYLQTPPTESQAFEWDAHRCYRGSVTGASARPGCWCIRRMAIRQNQHHDGWSNTTARHRTAINGSLTDWQQRTGRARSRACHSAPGRRRGQCDHPARWSHWVRRRLSMAVAISSPIITWSMAHKA